MRMTNTAAMPHTRMPRAGSYTMVLGVTDESGHSNSTFKTIVVSAK